MATSKEPSSTSRPQSGSFPRQPSTSRQHSNSLSLAPTNNSHRVNRRKSVNASVASNAAAAVAAVLSEQGEASVFTTAHHKRSLGSRKGTESTSMGAPSHMNAYFSRPTTGTGSANTADRQGLDDSADDNAIEEGVPADKGMSTKKRNRRASEGSYLVRSEGKRVDGELRCDMCGKSYKHSSCLTKHMWEHDPAWAYTSKLLISKHQQVQLLEAASVLVNMNVDSAEAQEGPHIHESEDSSASPGFSGSSEVQDDMSSVETTPPPAGDTGYPVPDQKRYSSSSAGFSRSYRSIPSSSYADSVISPGLLPHRFSGVDMRPATSGTDDGGLAAAAELLNFGTPRTRPAQMSSDVPPVPPLPERYQLAARLSGTSTTPTVYNPLGMHPPALTQQVSQERDVRTGYDGRLDDGVMAHGMTHTIDDEDAMFRMEE